MTASLPHDGLRVCVFEVNTHRFAVELASVGEVIPMAALSRAPSMPSILEGFLNLRGTAVPVVRLAALLGLSQDPLDLHTPLLILRGHEALALLVNRVVGILSLPAASLMPIKASDSFNGCVGGQLTGADGAVHLLSLDRLLLEKEQRMLSEFRATETSRLRALDKGAP